MSTPDELPVTVACPAWCLLPPGHTFDVETAGGSLVRDHERRLRQHPTLAGFYTYIAQGEMAVSEAGPIHLEAPRVHLGLPEGGGIDLTGDAAADLANWLSEALRDAAEHLSTLTSPTC